MTKLRRGRWNPPVVRGFAGAQGADSKLFRASQPSALVVLTVVRYVDAGPHEQSERARPTT